MLYVPNGKLLQVSDAFENNLFFTMYVTHCFGDTIQSVKMLDHGRDLLWWYQFFGLSKVQNLWYRPAQLYADTKSYT